MNGVRRFLGGTIAVGRSPSPSDTPTTPSPLPHSELVSTTDPTATNTTPVPDPMQATRFSSDDSSSSRPGRFSSPMSPGSPGTTTKGAFFRSKETSRPRGSTSTWNQSRSSSVSSRSRSPSFSGRRASSPRASNLPRPPLPSLAKAINSTDQRTRSSPGTASTIPLTGANLTWRTATNALNTKDELLMSLLASEAVVDSRESEILSAEEVEELKRDFALVSSKVTAAARKLSVETKIRDAAQKLHNWDNPSSSTGGSADQLVVANQKVELAQQELYKFTERANEISRRLLEHRAGVLSFSVRSLEKKAAVAHGAVPADTDSDTSTALSGEMSPASTTATSLSVAPKKFDGAHFFAGHADAITPSLVSPLRVKELEDKLKLVKDSLDGVSKRRAELEHELELLHLEKAEVETRMGLEIQAAEESVEGLKNEALRASQAWAADRRDLEDRLRAAESSQGRNAEAEEALLQMRAELMSKDNEIRRLLEERKAWEAEKETLRQSLVEMQAGATEELIVAREALRSMCRANRISVPPNDTQLTTFITALESHMSGFDDHKQQLLDSREKLNAELEEARREREEARRELRTVESKLRERSEQTVDRSGSPAPSVFRRGSGDSADYDKVVAALKPLWSIMPSVEARASRLGGARAVTPRSPKNKSGEPSPPLSLSELDVRSLKALYDPKGHFHSPPVSGDFTLEDFATRVQALIQDDRALVERLIRFAQAHDLLKANAERAQKLAQESSHGLDTYQKQVKTLEERNHALSDRQTELLDEIDDLHVALGRLEDEKRVLEEQAASQAETVKQLNEANNALSAKTLALASGGNVAPDKIMVLEREIGNLKKKLEDATDELDRTRMAESTQRVALLDELNSLQQENGTLRNQLRQRQGTR